MKTPLPKGFLSARRAEQLAHEAADWVNSNGPRIGYTVYGSHHFTEQGRSIPMVAYGAGTTKSEARKYRKILENGRYQVWNAPGGDFGPGYGLIVWHPAWNQYLKEDETDSRLKGILP